MKCSRLVLYQSAAFILTFLCYVLLHSTRKSFSVAKEPLQNEWAVALYGGRPSVACTNATSTAPDPSYSASDIAACRSAVKFEGVLDALFMFSYAGGLLLAGSLGDRYSNRWVLCISMCGSAAAYSLLGWSKVWSYEAVWLYVVAWIANGLLQSATWPTIVAIMGHWFPPGTRGTILGVWSANASVGNIVGDSISGWVQEYGWQWVFFVPGAMLFLGGIIMLLFLRPHPQDVGLHLPNHEDDHDEAETLPTVSPALVLRGEVDAMPLQRHAAPQPDVPLEVSPKDFPGSTSTRPRSAISCCRAMCLPNVMVYSLAYACIKASNYALFFWLPFYLGNALHWAPAVSANLSNLYDLGGIVGAGLQGIVSDCSGQRPPVMWACLLAAVPCLLAFRFLGTSPAAAGAWMLLAGAGIGGPANLISSAIAVDLARHPSVDAAAMATVTGIVDGVASIGAGSVQYLIPVLQSGVARSSGPTAGWNAVFYLLCCLTTMAAALLTRLLCRSCTAVAATARAERLPCPLYCCCGKALLLRRRRKYQRLAPDNDMESTASPFLGNTWGGK